VITEAVLNVAVVLALGSFLGGSACKIARVWRLSRPYVAPSVEIVDAPPRASLASSVAELVTGPALRFHRKSDPVWMFGCLAYHLAILLVVSGYAASSLALVARVLSGAPVPSLVEGAARLSPANVLTLIFGSTEAGASAYLFGDLAPTHRSLAASELPLALVGNLSFLYAIVRRRRDGTPRGLDCAAGGLRLEERSAPRRPGRQQLAVRLVILAIIGTEFAGQFGLVPGVALYHALLALLIIGVAPFTYLAHIPLAPLVVRSAVQRRRRHEIA
jgi:hypothetical protein